MECIPASPESLQIPAMVSAVRGNSTPRKSFPDSIPTAPKHQDRLLWTCSSFRAEAMKQDKIKVQARNDALQEVVRQLETDLKDTRQKVTDLQAKLADKEGEVSSLKEKLVSAESRTSVQPSQDLTTAIIQLLEALPSQTPSVQEMMKCVVDLIQIPEDKKSALLAKRTKRPSSLRRLFSFARNKSN
mmetsp:Transcript_8043/g.15802  ORF Transcript_8043/g.15802 Transcript_8043/m.15802 type:complete len:187 (-) Transcript_8043:269-829(-)